MLYQDLYFQTYQSNQIKTYLIYFGLFASIFSCIDLARLQSFIRWCAVSCSKCHEDNHHHYLIPIFLRRYLVERELRINFHAKVLSLGTKLNFQMLLKDLIWDEEQPLIVCPNSRLDREFTIVRKFLFNTILDIKNGNRNCINHIYNMDRKKVDRLVKILFLWRSNKISDFDIVLNMLTHIKVHLINPWRTTHPIIIPQFIIFSISKSPNHILPNKIPLHGVEPTVGLL